MIRRLVCCLPAAILLFASPLAAQSESSDSLDLGRKYTQWFLDGHADSLWSAMDEPMRGRVGGLESIENMMDMVIDQVGEEAEVVSESVSVTDEGLIEYRRLSEFDMADERIVFIWRINPDGTLGGAGIRPESQAPPAN